MEIIKCTIEDSSSVLDVLKLIDTLPSLQTVFVLNSHRKVVGTITDGDIRRGLIRGATINNKVIDVMYQDFSYLQEGDIDFDKISDFRIRKLKAVPLLSKKGSLVKVYDFTKIKSILPVDAVIMAGGRGERLKPLTNEVPKPLLKVGGKEIVSYVFDSFLQYGITNQHVTINYLSDQISDFCENYSSEINFNLIKEEEYLGTAGALTLINDFKNDVVLLINSDILTNIDFEDFYNSFLYKEADIMVASIPYKVNLPYAILNNDDDVIKSFQEKPNYTYYANAGIYLIKKEILSLIPKSKFFNATDLLQLAIEAQKKLMHYPIRSYWLDIGKHEDYEKAQKDISHIDFD